MIADMIKATQRPSLSRKTTTGKFVPMAVVEKLYPWLLLAAIFWLVWQLSQVIWLVVAPPKAPALTPVPMQTNLVAQSANSNALDFCAANCPASAGSDTPRY